MVEHLALNHIDVVTILYNLPRHIFFRLIIASWSRYNLWDISIIYLSSFFLLVSNLLCTPVVFFTFISQALSFYTLCLDTTTFSNVTPFTTNSV